MYENLRSHAAHCRTEIVDFTRQIIAIPSYSLGEAAVADQVQNLLERLDYDQVFRDDAGNVVGVMIGSEPGPTVLLNSHMDTVLPQDMDWEDEYLWGRVDGDRIYGLGAADCKGGLAAQIFAGHLLAKSALPLRGDVVVAATVAEENGCSVGARHLLEDTFRRLGLRPAYAVLGEPTDLGLCYGHDGWMRLDCRISGEARHAVRQAATLILQDIRDAAGAVNGRASAPMSATEPEWNRGAQPEAILQISRPIFPGENAESCLEQTRDHVARAVEPIPSVSVRVSMHAEQQRFYTGKTIDVSCRTEPWITDPFQPLFDRAREALKLGGWDHVSLTTWNLNRSEMGTAGSLLSGERRIPTLGFGPGEIEQAHAPNECLSMDKLVDAVFGTAVLVHSLIGAPLQVLARS
jgi:acetylornithine deacetylase/succinyl-diaminopimelate desuccinylase-like protein